MTFMGTSGEKHHSSFVDPPWVMVALLFLPLLLLRTPFPGSLWAQDIAQVKKGVVKITAHVEGQQPKVGTGFIV